MLDKFLKYLNWTDSTYTSFSLDPLENDQNVTSPDRFRKDS